MAAKNLAFTFLILVLVATPLPGMAVYVTPKNVTCHDVINYFAYCQEYVDGDYDDPTPACCDNLHIMNENVKKDNTEARRYCYCIEVFCATVGRPHPPYLQSRITDLNIKCNFHRSFPISEHMDCTNV
uniref:Non-specific lipid-transfer protein 13-like n=1 Tax=Nicotiana tabacum TaxID=4097 RepID=A0A1S3ZQS0_TOBAC|nr:non-specific lipid-transfer protein 13-like isoform X1 [Nicotiana tomentosiformis]XP_016466875.1 PREDICTED: non-specific lipid-transfer protein 13-like [Nicotiana tabacum]